MKHLLLALLLAAHLTTARGDEANEARVTVSAEQDEEEHDQFVERGDYGQPAWAERNRAAVATRAYILSPSEIFIGNLWEADVGRARTVHRLMQEFDVGLPHRFELGVENEIGVTSGTGDEVRAGVEARYAFADWGKLPLNPAISAEYLFGIGREFNFNHGQHDQDADDAVAFRLLLAHEFNRDLAYAANIGVAQGVDGQHATEFQFNHALTGAWLNGRLETGAEMTYEHSSAHGRGDDLRIGPVIGWKPTRQLRVEFSPMAGCTHDAPRFISALLISYELGGAETAIPSSIREH